MESKPLLLHKAWQLSPAFSGPKARVSKDWCIIISFHIAIFSLIVQKVLFSFTASLCTYLSMGALWPSGRASDSRARGQVFDTYLRRVVSLSKDTFTPQNVMVIPRKRWLSPHMTEKLFTGMLSLNKTKPNQTP